MLEPRLGSQDARWIWVAVALQNFFTVFNLRTHWKQLHKDLPLPAALQAGSKGPGGGAAALGASSGAAGASAGDAGQFPVASVTSSGASGANPAGGLGFSLLGSMGESS